MRRYFISLFRILLKSASNFSRRRVSCASIVCLWVIFTNLSRFFSFIPGIMFVAVSTARIQLQTKALVIFTDLMTGGFGGTLDKVRCNTLGGSTRIEYQLEFPALSCTFLDPLPTLGVWQTQRSAPHCEWQETGFRVYVDNSRDAR